jgi:ER lumen protein retaining receptor
LWSCSGISLKAQEIYLIVFLARYLDLFTLFYSVYNTLLKLLFISSTAAIVILIRCSEAAKSSYSPTHDSFQHWKFLLLPCLVIALINMVINKGLIMALDDPMEYIWAFSIYLESVAMLPQLIMFRSSDRLVKGNRGDAKNEILWPIFLLGIYRALYIANWVYRAHTERYYRHHYEVYACGVVQVFLYTQFFRM